MGSQNSEIDNDQFRQADWQQRQKEEQFQVWKSRAQPWQRLEQYEVLTQNDEQLKIERKAYEIRKRNPLLVAAYYFQSYPKDNFCSTAARHSLFIERIPIRLQDVEHVPYPDYLHIFDTSLKGFAQLARWTGFFPVEEGMIGINDDGVVKVWLNQYLASSRPFGKATEAQMVGSLIETIDRNIDHDQLPPSTPSVRNFLYRNSDALTFDVAIREFGQFVRRYNSGQVPIRLDCIDEVGGVYAIANRDRTNSNLKKSNVGRSRVIASESFQSSTPQLMPPLPPQQAEIRVPIIPPPIQNGQVYYSSPVQPIRNMPAPPPPAPMPIPVPPPNNAQQSIVISSQNQPFSTFQARASRVMKFTVQVTPGKVYPQKNSTIFMNGSSKVIPTESASKEVSLLDKIHPRIATSQKEVLIPVEKGQNSLRIIENAVPIAQTINEVHEDAVIQDTVRHSKNPAPDSKRSITEVFIPQEPAVSQHSHEPYQEQPRVQYGQNFMQFKDTVSVAQQSNPNSLAVSFNPAFEQEAFVNNSHQIVMNGQEEYNPTVQEDSMRDTGKFAETTRRTARRQEGERDEEAADEPIRETGKFNLNGRSGHEQIQYQQYYFDQNGLNQAYGHMQNPYKNFTNLYQQQEENRYYPEENYDHNLTEQAQIDLPAQYTSSSHYDQYISSLRSNV